MSQLSLKELEEHVVLEGIRSIISQYPSKEKPLQLYFLFAGNAKLERKIIKGILDNGYTISKVWFIDIAYTEPNIIQKISKGLNKLPFFKDNVLSISESILKVRYTRNKQSPNKITPENMFKVSPNQNANVIFLSDIDHLTSLMEDYISTNEPITMIAIHTPTIDTNAAEKIGTFYKMFYHKFNKPISFLWREAPYIYLVESPPNSASLSSLDVFKYTRDKQTEIKEQNTHRYKGQSYVILMGKRGGKYIVVGSKKIYI